MLFKMKSNADERSIFARGLVSKHTLAGHCIHHERMSWDLDNTADRYSTTVAFNFGSNSPALDDELELNT